MLTSFRRSAALRYPGSKWSIAQEIVSLFGDHHHYVEPYIGSGAVLIRSGCPETSATPLGEIGEGEPIPGLPQGSVEHAHLTRGSP